MYCGMKKQVSVCESFPTKNWSEIVIFFQVAKIRRIGLVFGGYNNLHIK
jgi:hypothetical protein